MTLFDNASDCSESLEKYRRFVESLKDKSISAVRHIGNQCYLCGCDLPGHARLCDSCADAEALKEEDWM